MDDGLGFLPNAKQPLCLVATGDRLSLFLVLQRKRQNRLDLVIKLPY